MLFSDIKLLDSKPEEHSGLWLSVSKMKTFKDCRLKYKFTYIDKLPRKDWDHLVYGSVVHDILERFHKELMKGNALAINLVMGQAYREGMEKFASKVSKEQKKEAYNLLKTYLGIINKEIVEGRMPEVLALEEPFFVDMDGKILLNGLIDKVQRDSDNLLHVQDYKTSKQKKYLEKDLFQLKVYAYVKFLQNKELDKVRTSYVMLKHNFDTVPAKPKEFSREEAMGIEKKLLEVYTEITEEKLWRPSPSPLCGYCDHQ
jgi:putative RecB family exonuclease